MTFDELLARVRAEHDAQPEPTARLLEEHAAAVDTAERAGTIASLIVHAIGENLHDYARAARLLTRIVDALPRNGALQATVAQLVVARDLAGDGAGAMRAELRGAALAPTDAMAFLLRTRCAHTQALVAEKRREEAMHLFSAVLDAAEDDEIPLDSAARAIAVGCNNVTSSMLEWTDRSAAESALMLRGAHVARRFWVRAGTWENDERADYLLALVCNALTRYDEAKASAERGLATIAQHGEENVDEAFLSLTLARAERGLGNDAAHAAALQHADALAAAFDEEWLREWFAGERAKVV